MVQKITWMLCFSIGTLSLISCGKKTVEPPIRTGTYVYINKSGQDIVIEAYRDNVGTVRKVKNNDSTFYIASGELPFPNFDLSADFNQYVIVKFDDGNCTEYKFLGTSDSEQAMAGGVYNHKEYDNYSQDLVNQKSYTLRYTIDSTDYKKAVPCK
ncbi:MAG: hypothetical protein U0V72_14895 [Cytophagales bacterium]